MVRERQLEDPLGSQQPGGTRYQAHVSQDLSRSMLCIPANSARSQFCFSFHFADGENEVCRVQSQA